MKEDKNISSFEEINILKAASLADSDAPENLSDERARRFVKETMAASEKPSLTDRLSALFKERMSVMVWGPMVAVAACALAVFLIKPSEASSGGQEPIIGQEFSVHASVDSVTTECDTTLTEDDSYEIIQIDDQE